VAVPICQSSSPKPTAFSLILKYSQSTQLISSCSSTTYSYLFLSPFFF
jgi:hypothetical protein